MNDEQAIIIADAIVKAGDAIAEGIRESADRIEPLSSEDLRDALMGCGFKEVHLTDAIAELGQQWIETNSLLHEFFLQTGKRK